MNIPGILTEAEAEELCLKYRSEGLVPVAREQHRRDMVWFVALLRGEAKRQAEEGSYTDVWRDDWALSYEFLADELERAWSPNPRSNP